MRATGISPTDTDHLEKRGFTRLHHIVLGLTTLDLKTYLDASNSDIDDQDYAGKTPLCWAASRPDTNTVKILLDYGANPVLGDRRGQTPLHYCAGSGTAESLALVAEEIVKCARRASSLSMASSTGTADLNTGLYVDVKDIKGRTPLNFAVRMNFHKHTEVLLKYGAALEMRDSTSPHRTPLLHAVYWNSHNILPLLLQAGCDITYVDGDGYSLLHYAAKFGDYQTLRILSQSLNGKLDIEKRNKDGQTALDVFAAGNGRCVCEDAAAGARSRKVFEALLANLSPPMCGCIDQDDESDSAIALSG